MKTAQFVALKGDAAGSVTGSAIWAGNWIAGSFAPAFTDVTAGGTLKVQASNEVFTNGNPATYTPTAASWSDIPSATSTIASGVGPAIALTSPFAYAYLRLVYTRSVGTGGANTAVVNACVLS